VYLLNHIYLSVFVSLHSIPCPVDFVSPDSNLTSEARSELCGGWDSTAQHSPAQFRDGFHWLHVRLRCSSSCRRTPSFLFRDRTSCIRILGPCNMAIYVSELAVIPFSIMLSRITSLMSQKKVKEAVLRSCVATACTVLSLSQSSGSVSHHKSSYVKGSRPIWTVSWQQLRCNVRFLNSE
jgi:hypothetical protein